MRWSFSILNIICQCSQQLTIIYNGFNFLISLVCVTCCFLFIFVCNKLLCFFLDSISKFQHPAINKATFKCNLAILGKPYRMSFEFRYTSARFAYSEKFHQCYCSGLATIGMINWCYKVDKHFTFDFTCMVKIE